MSKQSVELFDHMLNAARNCYEQNYCIPMLVLLYTLIDSMAWSVYGDEEKNVGEAFKRFCDDYLLPDSMLPCSAKELFAARCSVVHRLGWESNLTNKGVRSIFYSFESHLLKDAQAAADIIKPGATIGIEAMHLYTVISKTIDVIIDAAQKNSEIAERLVKSTDSQFRSIEQDNSNLFKEFLEKIDNGEKIT